MPHKILHQWRALEYNHSKKSASWSISIIIFAILFFIIGIWKYDITIIALAILGGFTILRFGRKKPKNIIFTIRNDGIQINNKLYEYKNLQSFWIFEEHNELVLHSQKKLIPLIHINLNNEDKKHIKDLLLKFLPIKEENYPIYDIFARFIGY
ncbi:MAG: hypothetical protein A2W64_02040 [Candidatus Zambryskibacteria bacterium RIFCSPLOWO2_02_39_10]|nr:MAG: hypothetical protein A2W64_02040 [Candidatus Zambryskibacteria bacterium RIFCSPLOWO2_02_39_10]